MTIYRRPSQAAAAGDAIPFFDGKRTHLFFLSSPSGTIDYPDRVRTTWQHAVTSDFRAFEELPPAVSPGTVGSYDGGGIWTGSVVEKDGIYHLFYTGHHVGAENPQTICLATSTDFVNFERAGQGPLIPPPAGFEPVDWRDPYVFYNEAEGCWWMLIAARLASGPKWRRGCIALATSDNLLNWRVESKPLYAPGTTFCPECPELWEMNGRWYMVYSRFSEDAGTIYRVADSPRGPFRVPENEDLGGRRWYAAKSAPQPDGSRVFFGWVHDFVEHDGRPRWLWGGDFAAPRLVDADEAGRLRVRLHPEVKAGFVVSLSEKQLLSACGGEAHAAFGAPLPKSVLLRARFDVKENPAAFGLALADNADLEGWFITLDAKRNLVLLAREPRPLDDFWADLTGRASSYRQIDGAVVAQAHLDGSRTDHRLTVLIDDDILEIYVNRTVALSHRIPRGAAKTPVAFVVDGDADVSLEVLEPRVS